MKKRVMVLCGVIYLSLSIYGCSKTGEITNETSVNETDSIQNNVTVGDSSKDSNKKQSFDFITMNLNETVKNEFMEVKFDSLTYTKELNPSDTSQNYYRYYEEQDGKQYFYLDGTVKSLSGYLSNPCNSVARIIFDDKYNYDASVYIETDNNLSNFYSIDPLTSCRIVIVASVPNEVIDSYSSVDILWGMTEDFGATSSDQYTPIYSWDDCTMGYEMKAK